MPDEDMNESKEYRQGKKSDEEKEKEKDAPEM
jgi:hypothetical protein